MTRLTLAHGQRGKAATRTIADEPELLYTDTRVMIQHSNTKCNGIVQYTHIDLHVLSLISGDDDLVSLQTDNSDSECLNVLYSTFFKFYSSRGHAGIGTMLNEHQTYFARN